MKSATFVSIVSLSVFRTVLFALVFFATTATYTQGPATLFQAPWRGFDTGIFGSGFGPASFAAGDMDNDGDVDMLVGDTYYGSTGISVLKNTGDRTFAQPVYYQVAQGQTVGEVSLADFDFDGDLDAFATIRGDFDQLLKIKIWRNNGNGGFNSPIDFATGQGPADILIADFTGDGKPDVVTANYGSSNISLLKHNGQTGMSAGFLAPVDFSTGTRPEKIKAADVNGDGVLDLIAGGRSGSVSATLSILINGGTGNFGAASGYDAAPGADYGATAIAAADLDNDGDIDLVGGGYFSVGSGGHGAMSIRRNNGTGAFGPAELVPFADFTPMPREINTGDINGDGSADLVAAVPEGRANDGFVIVTSSGSGGFNPAISYEASQQTFDAAIIDVDSDGDGDVVTLANSSAAITVHENGGSGGLRQLARYEVASLSDAVESADIDNDGDIDIVVNGEVDIASNDAIVKILKNNGNGTFAPAADYATPRNFADMKLRDINGDGFVDLIFAPDGNYPNYHFGTALNNGNGTFAPTVVRNIFSCGEGTIDAADLDGDGDRDIVLTEEQSCFGSAPLRIFIMRNDGSQSFSQMPNIVVAGLPHGLGIADATGDGKLDVITAQSAGMGVYPGNGDLTFGSAIISSSRPYKFTIADLNRDGRPDLGMIMPQDSFGTDSIATALGNGNGTFQPIRTRSGSSVLENLRISDDLEAADVNRDGTPDLVTFNYASNDLSVFLGNRDGSLAPHQRYGIGHTPIKGTIADFDRNGGVDIAAAIGLPPSGLHNAVVVLTSLIPTAGTVPFDFDGDNRTDISVWRPSDGSWHIDRSTDGYSSYIWGAAGDKTVAADFDADGKSDIAVWRSGSWYILNSSDGAFRAYVWGTSGDIPVAADYDNDGNADVAVYRPANNTFYVLKSTGGYEATLWGTTADVPVSGDYDGDRQTDIAVRRPSSGEWFIDRSTAGYTAIAWGIASDVPVQADYDGDAKDDVAVWRPSTGEWFVLRSSDGGYTTAIWGAAGDVPVPGDYDGDGNIDIAVVRNGTWHIDQSTAGYRTVPWGIGTDVAVPGRY